MSPVQRTSIYIALVFLLSSMTALAARPETDNESCLACHGDSSIEGKNHRKPFIEPTQFESTTHASVGCKSCHASVDENHPDDGKKVTKATCRECHEQTWDEYSKSVHAGNAECADCHNPHAVKGPVSVSGRDINKQCEKCHETKLTLDTHSKWLPQAQLHVQALPCTACHTASKDYVITLFVEKRAKDSSNDFVEITHEDLATWNPDGNKTSELIDTNGDKHVSLDELRKFNRSTKERGMRLWGMLMPETMTHSYQILRNRWDCSFCHASGPDARQTSYIALPQASRKYERLEVQKGAILELLLGAPEFYMVGSTRSLPLSILGLLIVTGGAAFPLIHGSLRFLTRRRRSEHSSHSGKDTQ
ncbi:MAG: cytochrome C [Bdellovibrionales bacterium GWB1_55_8]|nr:MAG: cytochrome C [Bdellovibrionales bacterium GWB1_55_8]